jgi:putative chitinase
MEEFDIHSPVLQAHLIAQIGHESLGFTCVNENLNYEVDGLLIFSSRLTQEQ